MKPGISIIIPVYCVEAYIRQCLDSIVKENVNLLGTVEIIVVDDGSPDASGEIVDQYKREYPHIKVIHKKNAGVAAARNSGICEAQGEWLYFMDSDDWLEAGALAQMCEQIKRYPQADIILFDAYQNIEGKQRVWEHFSREQVWQESEEIRLLQCAMLYYPIMSAKEKTGVSLAAPWDKLYRRAFVEKNKLLFQEQLKVLDDMIFNVEAFGRASMVTYNKGRIYHYRYVPNSITNSYKPNRVQQDRQVWAYLEDYMERQKKEGLWSETQSSLFQRALACRIVKSFSICCRLSFFHTQNTKRLSEKRKEVGDILSSDPYHKAFFNARFCDAEWRLKIMLPIGRMRWSYGVWILYQAQRLLSR